MSQIQWCDRTWNCLTGCTPVSKGCQNCYAAQLAATRLKDHPRYKGLAHLNSRGVGVFNGTVLTHEDKVLEPLSWRKPSMVFVNSMSDVFHESVPFEFIDKMFAVMALCPQHTFQILTKRPERMAEYLNWLDIGSRSMPRDWIDRIGMAIGEIEGKPLDLQTGYRWIDSWRNGSLCNVWLGTSVERQQEADERIPYLLRCPAAVRFLSCEPLIGEVDLTNIYLYGCGGSVVLNCLRGIEEWDTEDDCGTSYSENTIDWVIVGGESGKHARPCNIEWIRSIVQQCRDANVPVFVKQLGKLPTGLYGHRIYQCDSKGGNTEEWPEDLRVRQWPVVLDSLRRAVEGAE